MRLTFAMILISLASLARADLGEADQLFASSMQEIRQNRLDSALTSINKLLDRYPNFRLAQLVKGDLLLARARPISTLGNAAGEGDKQADLRDEAMARIKAVSEPMGRNLVPEEILQVSKNIEHVLAVDASRSRLYIYENSGNGIKLVADYYVTVGKLGTGKNREGDKRTPVGLYTITGFKPDSQLEELYGAGAYPLSYPNEWDVRNGRNGYGIWLHGVPRETYSRPPKASDGCVVLSNDDLKSIGSYIRTGETPIIIAPQLTWADPASVAKSRDDLQNALDNWRNDWESLDTNRLLNNYSRDLAADGKDFRAFADSKYRVNAAKSWINLGLNNVSIYLQPGNSDMAIVSFDQDYKSSNLNNISRKRQYWQRENGRWRIIHETIL